MLVCLRVFELKNVLPIKHCPTCGRKFSRHLRVLACDEKEALLMRRYLLNEGFEV